MISSLLSQGETPFSLAALPLRQLRPGREAFSAACLWLRTEAEPGDKATAAGRIQALDTAVPYAWEAAVTEERETEEATDEEVAILEAGEEPWLPADEETAWLESRAPVLYES